MSEKHYHAFVKRLNSLKNASQTAQNKGISRRRFLQLAGMGGLALALHQFTPRISAQAQKTIIVIGAGASGIAAARELHDAGHNVIVLEARDRIGGRVWTDTRLANTPLDLGASWVHGISGNPVWDLVQEYAIPTQPTDYEDVIIYTPDGEELPDETVETLAELLDELLVAVDDIRQNDEDDRPLRDVVNLALADMDLTTQEIAMLEFGLMTRIENDYANSLEGLSAYNWDEAEEFGGDDVLFPRGYGELFAKLAEGLDIRLNHIVSEIKYTADGATLITQNERFTADKVIVTVPLGVLKRNKIAFSPPLPENKQTAINRLAMGALNKVYLLFNAVFWDEETQFFVINDASVGFVDWVNFYPITGKPILMAFYSGREQARLEAMSEADIIAEALGVLTELFDGVEEAFFEGIATRWGVDEFAYGSYSSYGVGSMPDDRLALVEPLMNVLYFAGEATRTDHPATVHGAVMSGYDVAELILGE
ncbi:MAG: FAD-dependent oxidoreductase [bacterium]|nr:FAD-dependent oxidoreductase [bacterium]